MKQLPLPLFKDTEIFRLTDKDNREEIIKNNPYLGPRSKPMGYNKYIASEDWKRKKKFAIQLADYKCEICEKSAISKSTIQIMNACIIKDSMTFPFYAKNAMTTKMI